MMYKYKIQVADDNCNISQKNFIRKNALNIFYGALATDIIYDYVTNSKFLTIENVGVLASSTLLGIGIFYSIKF